MLNWHVSKGENVIGPLAEGVLVERIQAGEFPKGSLVWKKGMKTWEPIEIYFADALTLGEWKKPAKSIVITETPPTPPQPKPMAEDSTQIRPNAEKGWIKYAAAMVVFFSIFFTTHENITDLADPVTLIIIWGGTIVAALVSGVLFLRTLWNLANKRALEKSGSTGGSMKLACVFCGIIFLVFSVLYVPQGSLIYRVGQARKVYDKFSMDFDPGQDAIIIDGTIGPNFAKQLKQKLDVHAGIDTIVITSPGGLVDQALETAKIIEDYGNLTVVARRICNSACLLVLMAGDTKLADWDMDFGFHATSYITHVDENYEDYMGLTELSEEADQYFLKRGVPESILTEANAKGAKSMENVPSIKLADLKIISGLLDRDKLLSLDLAKWRIVENAMGKQNNKNVLNFNSVLQAIRESSPFILKAHADNLYQAYRAADVDKFSSTMGDIMVQLVPAAMKAADGPELYSYTMNNLKQIEYLKTMEDWNTCASYLDGNAASGINVMSQSALRDELTSLSSLIRSAGSKEWKEQPIPKWAERKGEEITQGAAVAAMNAGIDLNQLDKNPYQKCIWTYVLIKLITEEGVDRAPPILRTSPLKHSV
jgi:hypothetical protein